MPEDYRERFLSLLSNLPAIPQMTETGNKRDEESGQDTTIVQVSAPLWESPLARFLNGSVILLTLVTYFWTACFDMLALKPNELTSWEPVPRVWTIVTCGFFSEGWIYLFANLLVINYLIQ